MGKTLSSENNLTGSTLAGEGRFIPESSDNNIIVVQGHGSQNPDEVKLNNTRQNDSPLSNPRVPVIFILGGPGSGKITHCDRAVVERPGLAHINMTDLIQQHIVANSLTEFSQMPARTLIEVLQMEMKMAVTASAYLISGYPRSMRDVVEYNEKIKRVDHAILLNWHVKILEKQIEFGAQLGETVLQLARMELKNYTKNVLSVAEYFDQLKILSVVDGERQPSDVYSDFLTKIDRIIQDAAENSAKDMMLRKNNNVNNSSNSFIKNHSTSNGSIPIGAGHHEKIQPDFQMKRAETPDDPILNANNIKNAKSLLYDGNKKLIFVIGGPGSNKSLLCGQIQTSKWKHLSIGKELRAIKSNEHSIANGELVKSDHVVQILIDRILSNKSKNYNLIIDGFPRSIQQLKIFQDMTGLDYVPCVLIDCSEIELGRSLGQRKALGRLDDLNPAAIKMRLDTYRLVTLPTLKILDDQKRLYIVDGDSDRSTVVNEFRNTLSDLMKNAYGQQNKSNNSSSQQSKINSSNNIFVNNKNDKDGSRKLSTDTIDRMLIEVQEEEN